MQDTKKDDELVSTEAVMGDMMVGRDAVAEERGTGKEEEACFTNEKATAVRTIDPSIIAGSRSNQMSASLTSVVGINDIPSEVLRIILGHVSIRDISAVARTSQRLHAIMIEMIPLMLKRAGPNPIWNEEYKLYWWAESGYIVGVRALILAGADVDKCYRFDYIDDWVNPNGETPLYAASRKRHVEVVQALIAAGADVNKGNWFSGETPLYVACLQGYVEVVNELIKGGADVDLSTDGKNSDGTTPGYDTDDSRFYGDSNGDTPLVVASSMGHVEVVQALIAAGADVHKWNRWQTPLEVASEKGHVEVVQALLAAGVDFERRNEDNEISFEVALEVASEKGHVEVVQALIAAKAHNTS